MKHEKIFKRGDGSRAIIAVDLWIEGFTNKFTYKVSVTTCEPKKRTFRYVNDTDDYTWRGLNSEQRKDYEMKKFLEHVTMDEIQETAMELWQQIKPSFL